MPPHYTFSGGLVGPGANRTIKNNEKQTPYDLSAKNPEVGRLLMIHAGKELKNRFLRSFIAVSPRTPYPPPAGEEGYEDEEDVDD